MLGKNHLIYGIEIAVIGTSLFYPNGWDAILFGTTCIISSLFPDIDSPDSLISKPIKPLSIIINRIFGHRKIFHSPLFHLICFSLLYYFYNHALAFGFLLGIFSHLFLDLFTIKGIPLFFPISSKYHHLTSIKTGTKQENLLFFFIFAITLILYFIVLGIIY